MYSCNFLKNEERIFASRSQAIDPDHTDRWIEVPDVGIGEQEALGKVDLLKTSCERINCRIHIHGRRSAKRDCRKNQFLHF